MSAKSFTLDGKRYRLNPKTPTYAIWYHMRGVHVGTSDDDVIADIDDAISKSPARNRYTPKIIEQCRKYALRCHRINQELYKNVMRGT